MIGRRARSPHQSFTGQQGFTFGLRPSLGRRSMRRQTVLIVDRKMPGSSTSQTSTQRRFLTLVGAFLISTTTVASIGRVTFLRRMDWTTTQRRLHGSLIQCGAGFVKSVGDRPTPRLAHSIFCQMPGHDMDNSRPIEHKRSETEELVERNREYAIEVLGGRPVKNKG